MALEANAYTVSDATTDKVIPSLYDEVAEKFLYETEVLRPLGADKSGMLLGKPGKSITVYKETQFSVSGLVEGISTQVSALDFANVELNVNWYGDAKQIGKENLSYAFDFVWGDIREGAAKALGENRDNVIMTELLNTTSLPIYPINTGTGAHYSDSDIPIAKGLSYKQIVEARTAMKKNKRVLQYVVVSPDQAGDLLNDEKFISSLYGAQGTAINGQLGKMAGATFIESNTVQTTDEGSGDLVTVYNAIALGPKAFLYAQKVSPVFEFDEETKRARSVTFHYYEAFGVKVFYNESIIVLKSS